MCKQHCGGDGKSKQEEERCIGAVSEHVTWPPPAASGREADCDEPPLAQVDRSSGYRAGASVQRVEMQHAEQLGGHEGQGTTDRLRTGLNEKPPGRQHITSSSLHKGTRGTSTE